MQTELESNRAEGSARRRPEVRAVQLDFTEVPRYWMHGSVLGTAMVNGVGLLFPAGERFFIRSVRHYLPEVDDMNLREDVRAFFGQEGRHAGAHERYFGIMRSQGYRIDDFLKTYERVTYELLEKRLPPALRLSVTAALEHFTATMADSAVGDGLFDDVALPMKRLHVWHAFEELEHRSVAFDVLQKVAPSYALRIAGLAVATLGLAAWWIAATRMLLAQEPKEKRKNLLTELREVFSDGGPGRHIFLHGLRSYLARDFHPSQLGDDERAKKALEEVGLRDAA